MINELVLVKTVLVSGIICLATAVMCPDSSQWKLRARATCNSSHPSFNCLFDESSSTFVEFCTRRPDFQRPGYKFVIRGNIDGIECEKNRFQPIKFWTNGSSDCILEKTHCNELGQVFYDEGNSKSDRKCRCDYTKGFAFVSHPKQDCFCNSHFEDCSCFRKSCRKFQVLTPDYNCIAIKDWTGIFKCPVIMKTGINNATSKKPRCPAQGACGYQPHTEMKRKTALAVTLLTVFTVIIASIFIKRGTEMTECCNNLRVMDTKIKKVDRRLEEKTQNLDDTMFKIKLKVNYKVIITTIKTKEHKEIVDHLNLSDTEIDSIELWIGRIKKNKALLEIVWKRGLDTYIEFIKVLRQSNSALADVIDNTKGSDYREKDLEDLEKIYNQKLPEDVRRFHEKIIKDWKMNEKMIIETRISRHIREECLTNSNCVVLVGHSTSGKSSILRQVILTFVKENELEEFDIMPVVLEPSHVLKYYDENKNQIFLIDDFCGTDKVNDQLLHVWKLNFVKFLDIINQSDSCEYDLNKERNTKTKILISCNINVYENSSFIPLKKHLNTFVCELWKFPLSNEERERMIKIYAPAAQVNEDIFRKEPIGNFDFPLLCKLSKGKNMNEIRQLFSDPLQTIKDDLKKVQSENNLQFLAIALCTLCNNKFKANWLNLSTEPGDIHLRNAVKEMCMEFNIDLTHDSDRKNIQDQFGQEHVDWLSKSGDTYHLIHDKIFNITSVICGESYTDCFIKHAPSSFIAQRFIFGDSSDGLISLGEKYEKQYFNRLIRDLDHGLINSTFQNVQLQNETYRKKMIAYLKGKELKFKEILGNLRNDNLEDKTEKRPFCEECNCRKGMFCYNFKSVNVPFVACARLGFTDIVELLLEMKCNVNEKDISGKSALCVAAEQGHIEIVKMLVENKTDAAKIALRDDKGRTALHMACEEGHTHVVEYLLEKGADISACDNDGYSPLHIACASGKPEIVEFLLKEYMNDRKEAEIEKPDNLGQTPIIVAASKGETVVVEILLKFNANINGTDKRGITPLLTACLNGYSRTVKILITKDANLFHLDNDGRSALYIACEKGHEKIVKILIKKDKNIIKKRDSHYKSPIYIACAQGKTEVVETLIKNNANINCCDENEKSLIYVACEKGHDKIVKVLLFNGADIDKGDRYQNLPLHVACKRGNLQIVKLLQDYKDQSLKVNKWNETALQIAEKQGHYDIKDFLTGNTSDLKTKNKSNV